MANVQPEKGWLKLANDLAEAIAKARLGMSERRVMDWVIRNTYGWQIKGTNQRCKVCAYSWSKIAKEVKGSRQAISRAGNGLISRGLLLIDAAGLIGIQKDYEKWAKRPATPATLVAQHSQHLLRNTHGQQTATHMDTPIPYSLKKERKGNGTTTPESLLTVFTADDPNGFATLEAAILAGCDPRKDHRWRALMSPEMQRERDALEILVRQVGERRHGRDCHDWSNKKLLAISRDIDGVYGSMYYQDRYDGIEDTLRGLCSDLRVERSRRNLTMRDEG